MAKRYTLFALFTLLIVVSASASAQVEVPEITESTQIWTGESIEFEKEAGADPTVEENQDRITENVWITRGNEGGQIYNAAVEDSFDQRRSPEGTVWAEGTTDDLPDLDFFAFRQATGQPRSVPGRDFVMYLVEDDIYIDVHFISWDRQKQGGFSYRRSTPAE